MPKNRPARAVARLRFRGVITTLMLILMMAMIVRDIIVRRWASPPSPDLTRRLP